MDPPNVLWFAGTYALALASYGLLETLPESHSSIWIFVAAVGFFIVYSALSCLDERRWPFAVALLGVGLSLFVTGMLQHRFKTAWARYFVRRPPPSIDSSP